MEFEQLNPLLHNELRLKVMVALDALDDADFVYLKNLTKATAGNLSVQIGKLEEAGYIRVFRSEYFGDKSTEFQKNYKPGTIVTHEDEERSKLRG